MPRRRPAAFCGEVRGRERRPSSLPTSLPGGALNASPTGSVVRHSTALALRADGNPWVAGSRSRPTRQSHTGLHALSQRPRLESAIAVETLAPAGGVPRPLMVEPSGQVVVAWLDAGPGTPAQLRVSRYDPAGQVWHASIPPATGAARST